MSVQEQASTPPVEAGDGAWAAAASGRIPALDGARGLAILAVMLFHFSFAGARLARTEATWLDDLVGKVVGPGWAGVDMFFVLSGFLITGLLLNAKGTSGFLRFFYARRWLRIWPAYYVVLIVLMAVVPLIDPAGEAPARELTERILWYATFAINIVATFGTGLSLDLLLGGHLWSIAVEEQFYLVWPVVVLLLNRRLLVVACCGMIVGALAIRIVLEASGESVGAYLLMPARMDGLAVGALVAVAARDPAALRMMRKYAPWTAAALTVLTVLFVVLGDLTPPRDSWTQTVGFSAVALLFGALLIYVIGAKTGDFGYGMLVSKPLTAMGKYSYAMYLVHVPILRILMWKEGGIVSDASVYGSFLFGQLGFILVAGTISFMLAWLSWRVLESPFLQAKTLFPYGSESSGQHLSM